MLDTGLWDEGVSVGEDTGADARVAVEFVFVVIAIFAPCANVFWGGDEEGHPLGAGVLVELATTVPCAWSIPDTEREWEPGT